MNLENYNAETPMNILSTTLFVLSAALIKEGYRMEDVTEIVIKVGDLTSQILVGNMKITEKGIVLASKQG